MVSARPFLGATLLVAAIAAAGLTGAAPASAIANGAAETGADRGFIAKIQYGPAGGEGSTACTGSIINARFVLTAKSCLPAVDGKPAKSLSVTVGRPDLSQTAGYALPGVEVLPHPDRDLALVRLAADLPATVSPALLATVPPAVGATIQVAGFGRTAADWVPDQVHVAPMTVADVAATELHTEAAEGVSTCMGDAGGPAFTMVDGRAVVAAINGPSWQLGCLGSTSTHGGTTEVRVDDLKPWIDGLLRVRNNQDVVRNVVSDMCVAIDTGAKTAGLRMEQWWCTDSPDQRWVQTALGGSAVQLRNAHSNLCMGVKTSTASNAPVSQEACSGTGQQWSVESMSTGELRYRNKLNGSCFADPSSSTTAGTQLITWTCDDMLRRDQHWTVRSRDASRLLRNEVTNGCVRSNGAAAGYLVDQENCHDFQSQRYAFPGNATTTTVVNEATQRCLSPGAGTVRNTQLVLEVCDGSAKQNWTITRSTVNGDPAIRFENAATHLCMGVAAANPAEGTRVIQWTCGAADHWFRA